MYTNVIVKSNSLGYSVSMTDLRFRSKNCSKLKSFHEKKLESSISRAKSAIFDYALNNDFKFFVTFTLSSKYDRYDLSSFKEKIDSRIKYMRKKGFKDLKYVLIPEKHKDGAWHFHGLLSAGFGEDMYFNDYGYLSLSSFDSLGFTSISKIRSYEACCKYVLKYINKDMCEGLRGQHLYYCSRGLQKSKKILQFYSDHIQPLRFDFLSPFVSKKDFNYYNLITYIDTLVQYDKIFYVVSDEQGLFD